MSFKYKHVYIQFDNVNNTLENQLEQFSNQGWEIVTIDQAWKNGQFGWYPSPFEREVYLRKFVQPTGMLDL